MASASRRSQRLRTAALVAGAYAIAAVFATWPLARFAGARVAYNLADPVENVWIHAWGAHALRHQPLHLFDGNIFWPARGSLAFAENLLGQTAPMAPIFWATKNGVLLANAAALTSLVLCGVGMYLLARELRADRAVAFTVGLGYMLLPYRLAAIAHPHVAAMGALPVALLGALKLRRGGGRRAAAIVAVALAVQMWSSLTGGVMALVALSVWAVVDLGARRRAAGRAVGLLAAGMTAGMALSLPVVLPYLTAHDRYPEYTRSSGSVASFAAVPSSYLAAPPAGRIVEPLMSRLAARFPQTEFAPEQRLFPGLWLALFGVAGLAVGVARTRGVPRAIDGAIVAYAVVVSVVGVLLSFGPRWDRDPDGLRLPYALVETLAPGALLRVPARFVALAVLGLCIAATSSLALLHRRWRGGLPLAVVLLAAQSWAPGVPTIAPPPLPAAYHDLVRRPGAVVALPTFEADDRGVIDGPTVAADAFNIYASTANFRPLVNGYGAFQPRVTYLVGRLLQDFPSDRSFAALAALDVRTVVVDTRFTPGTPWADVPSRLAAWPGVDRLSAPGSVAVYDVVAAGAASLRRVPRPFPRGVVLR